MTIRKLDVRLYHCLRNLIFTIKNNSQANMYYLLEDPSSYISRACDIRNDFFNLSDPDKYIVATTFDAIFSSFVKEVETISDPVLKDDILYESSRLRDYMGFDKILRKPHRPARPPLSR